jgi:hypothetical protein
MPLRSRTKEELEALRNAAPIIEEITYKVVLNHFKKQVKQNPTNYNKSVYALIKDREIWNELRHLQDPNHTTPTTT